MSADLHCLAIVIFLLVSGGCANLSVIQTFCRFFGDTAGFSQESNAFATSPLHHEKFTCKADVAPRSNLNAVYAAPKPMLAELQLNQQPLAAYTHPLADQAADERRATARRRPSTTGAPAWNALIHDNKNWRVA